MNVRRTAASAAVTVAIVAAGLVADVAPASAAVNTTMTFTCSPGAVTAPATATCTATVTNDKSQAPSGTVTMSKNGQALQFAGAGPTCTVATVPSPARTSACSLVIVAGHPGNMNLTAAFTNTGAGDNLTATTTVSVSNANSPGLYSPHSQSNGARNDLIDLFMSGCPANNYFGFFVSSDGGDPLGSSTAMHPLETTVASDQSAEWHVNLPPDNPLGTFRLRFYCASAPLASAAGMSDASVTSWVSGLYTFTVS